MSEAQHDETLEFGVDGMMCGACVARVEKKIRKVAGVTEASVNLATERAKVTLEAGSDDPAAVFDAVESAGYTPVAGGINDAPALTQADVGIAVGSGTDIAIEAGDVVLMRADLSGVVNALALAGRTMRTIRINFGWAYGYNVLLIPLAAGVFYPLTGWLLNPAIAAAAMSVSSIFVLKNSLRLRRFSAVLAPVATAASAQPQAAATTGDMPNAA